MKHQLILATLLFAGIPMAYAQDSYDDDIYYNPKKDKNQTETVSKKKQSNYIANFSDIDVDTYNRRGEQYYASPVDTIGSYVENGEDFVYTQQIQKYYNPTIVVDNADVLGDVLSNAYGNVEIVIDDAGLPIFTPYYGYGWGYPYSWRYSNWGLNVGPWGWSVGFYDPWYAWNWGPSWGWGPSWAWGPSWNWGWGPSWGWGPAWGGPHHGPRPSMASWRPSGNNNVGPRPGWSHSTRPGGNMASHRPGSATNRPAVISRPGSSTARPGSSVVSRPNTGHAGVVNNNGRWEYNTTKTTGHRQAGTGVVNSTNRNNSNSGNRVMNRVGNTTNRNNNSVNTNRNNTTNRSYNTNTNRSYNYNRGTTTNRSTGGSFGGGNRGGGSTRGGGGGRHR